MISVLSERLIEEKLETLNSASTWIHNKLSRDHRIADIKVTKEKKLRLTGTDGTRIKELSAGQLQLLITALIFALSETTGFRAPFVIDTPLARLDEDNRDNMINFLSKLPQQVILLTQTGEINAEQLSKLGRKVRETFLVNAEDLNNGFSRSQVFPRQYFTNTEA